MSENGMKQGYIVATKFANKKVVVIATSAAKSNLRTSTMKV